METGSKLGSLGKFENGKLYSNAIIQQNEREPQLLLIPSVKTSGHHYIFPEGDLKDTQKQFTENLRKHSFMHLL